MKMQQVAVDSIQEHPQNARRGDVDVIRESLSEHGQYAPIVVQRSTSFVLKGNHTLRAARELGWKRIAAVFVDVDDDRAKRILLVDNRASDLGAYDDHMLRELLSSLDDLTGTGYSDDDLAGLLAQLEDRPPAEFPTVDENAGTDHVCPSCGYAWNGKAIQ